MRVNKEGIAKRLAVNKSKEEIRKLKSKSGIKLGSRTKKANQNHRKKSKAKKAWWKKYRTYLRSPEWKAKREELFKLRGKLCETCTSTRNIQVHHLTYKRVFNEKLNDLQVLCKSCHKKIHNS